MAKSNNNIENTLPHLRNIHFLLFIVSFTIIVSLTNIKHSSDQIQQEFIDFSQLYKQRGYSSQDLFFSDIESSICLAIGDNCNNGTMINYKINKNLILTFNYETILLSTHRVNNTLPELFKAKNELIKNARENYNSFSQFWKDSALYSIYITLRIDKELPLITISENGMIKEFFPIKLSQGEKFIGGNYEIYYKDDYSKILDRIPQLSKEKLDVILEKLDNPKFVFFNQMNIEGENRSHIGAIKTNRHKGLWLQNAFIKKRGLTEPWKKSNELSDIFPNLDKFRKEIKFPIGYSVGEEQYFFKILLDVLRREEGKNKSVAITGIDIDKSRLSVFGSIAILSLLLYMYVHLENMVNKQNRYPWVYLYSDKLSYLINLASIFLIPIGALMMIIYLEKNVLLTALHVFAMVVSVFTSFYILKKRKQFMVIPPKSN